MAFVALPIRDSNGVEMSTALAIFTDGDGYHVRPVSIDSLIMAERESLRASEKAWQNQHGGNGIPFSFNMAERFCNILSNPPAVGQNAPVYEAAVREYIGLLTVFACRNLLGLHIEKREIDMSENSSSPILIGLGNELARYGADRVLSYFCIDRIPFAYLYRNMLVPIKDREHYKRALTPVPFFNRAEGTFDDILSASNNQVDIDSGRLLIKQLLYSFLFDNSLFNDNALFLRRFGTPYLDVTDRVANACQGLPTLSFISVSQPDLNKLEDALLNAPVCHALPQNLFSDKLLLLYPSIYYQHHQPCFGEVVYDDELYNVVNPISQALCATISQNPNVTLDNPNGAPDCSYEDDCITCRIRLTVFGISMTIPRKYSVRENCIMSNLNGTPLESINMGIDCNVNPCAAIPSIFRRYIVWNGPECIGVSFDQPLNAFPVTHLCDKATVAIVEPIDYLPKFAYLDYYGEYCGCIQFPAPLNPTYTHLNVPTSIFLDFGATNSVCLVEYGGMHTYVDIKEYVAMVTGENAEFRIFHLLSDRDNNGIVRNMAVCSVEANHYNSSLYRAHAINGGETAINYIVNGISSDALLDLASVNIFDNISWTDNILANEGYCAIVGSIFSSAFAKLLERGFNPSPELTTISISIPDSFGEREKLLTKHRVMQALSGIQVRNPVNAMYDNSVAAATYCFKELGAGVMLGNSLNVGVDIGGGSINLFSFASKIGGKGLPVPMSIDSLYNAAGRKILSETVAKAAQYYYARKTDPDPDSNPFFKCFDAASVPPVSLNKASERVALCITETFIPEAKFNEMAGGTAKRILRNFRRNVLFKLLAVLNYAAEFAKISWQWDAAYQGSDISQTEVNLILCGNGSNIFSQKWAGISRSESEHITEFFRNRIGCSSLHICMSEQPKKEVVLGMKYIEADGGVAPLQGAVTPLDVPISLVINDIDTFMEYVRDLLDDMRNKDLLRISGDLDNITAFYSVLMSEASKKDKIRSTLQYVLNHYDIHYKGDRLFLATVFLRLVLKMPYIDDYFG